MMDATNVINTKSPHSKWSEYILDHMVCLGIPATTLQNFDQSSPNTEYMNSGQFLETNKSSSPPVQDMHPDQESMSREVLDQSGDEDPALNSVIVAINKSDLLSEKERTLLPSSKDAKCPVCILSCSTSEGLDAFTALLADQVKDL